MAYENVIAYMDVVDPAKKDVIDLLYNGFKPYMATPYEYQSVPATTKITIRNQLQDAYDMIADGEALYVARSSQKEFDYALQSARVILQGEDMYSYRNNPGEIRDMYMAENVEWILEQEGPGAKIVLWAHNYHVMNNPGGTLTMGTELRERFGDEMVTVGFSFFSGTFNAVPYDPATGYGALKALGAPPPPKDSYGYHFRGADMPRLILDLRGIDFDSTATDWIPGPRRFRSIGAVYDPDQSAGYYYQSRLPVEFDLIVYFQSTTASALLPFPEIGLDSLIDPDAAANRGRSPGVLRHQ
jgi:erythromycin esterase